MKMKRHRTSEKRLEIIDSARSETFRMIGNNGKWARIFMTMFLMAVGVGILVPQALSHFFGFSPFGLVIYA